MTPAQRFVRSLHARGYTDAQIARAVGKDRSAIGKIRKGTLAGKNLEADLQRLARTRSKPPGRGGTPKIPQRRPRSRFAGFTQGPAGWTREYNEFQEAELWRDLLKLARYNVMIDALFAELVEYSSYKSEDWVSLFSKGGWLAGDLINSSKATSAFQLITDLARAKPGVRAARGVEAVHMTVVV